MQDQEYKYLAIRNWAKWQTMTDKNGKSLDGRARPYIRDYTDKETDSQYAELSVFGRYFFDACRRLRGKLGRNIPNDHMWIMRQLDVHHTERGRGAQAIQALITRGLLIPTSQQLDFPQPSDASLNIDQNVDVDVDGSAKPMPSAGTQEGSKPKPSQSSNISPGSSAAGLGDSAAPREEDEDLVRFWASTISKTYRGKELTPELLDKAAVSCFKYMSAAGVEGRKRVLKAYAASQKKAGEASVPSLAQLVESAAPEKICTCPDDIVTPEADGTCRFCGGRVLCPDCHQPLDASGQCNRAFCVAD